MILSFELHQGKFLLLRHTTITVVIMITQETMTKYEHKKEDALPTKLTDEYEKALEDSIATMYDQYL